ncbi:MAG: PAS domain S-box protein [Methanoregula sp.]|jgi:PAS domain S-box-containing protein
MWIPDSRTRFLIIFISNLFLALILLIYWKTQKTSDGFQIWTASLLLIVPGYLLLTLRDYVPDILSIVVANLLVVLSLLMRVDSTRRYFQSKPLPHEACSVLFLIAVLYLYFTYVADLITVRSAIMTALIVPCLLVSAYFAVKAREPETRLLKLFFAGSLSGVAALMVIRSTSWLTITEELTLMSPDLSNLLFFIGTIVADILSTSLFIMLNMARSQTELRSSEERYRNLAENLPDYVIIHDGKRIRYANPAAARRMGVVTKDLEGREVFSLFTPESVAASRERIRALEERKVLPDPAEADIRIRDGSIRHCLVKTVLIQHCGESVFMSVATDITERKAVEDALARANTKLAILSSITRHDIKNQLVPLSGYLDLSSANPGNPAAVSEYLAKATKIAGTIERQIDFTRIYEDLGTTAPVWQNVGESVSLTVKSLPMGEIRVTVDRPDLEIFADRLVEKVFFNLIDNALRYGGPKMTEIRFSSRETENGLVLVCEDDGAGIRGEDKARLFQKGFGKNTGLGLFLSREILAITGIAISETGEAGKGARFEMVVPKGAYRFTGKQ